MGEDVGAPGSGCAPACSPARPRSPLGATGEGMVAGDLVNTAQPDPVGGEPGPVLVGEATRRATDAAVALRAGGLPRAQGQGRAARAVPCAAGRGRVAAARCGSRVSRRRSSAATASCGCSRTCSTPASDHRTPQLVTVTGIAGVGKSRLSWEFEKYIDGLADDVLVAPGPLPVVRRRGDLLGAGRHGADAGRVGRGRGAGRRSPPSSPTTVAEFVPDADERALDRAPARSAARARRPAARPGRTTCSPPGGCSSSGCPTRTRSCWSSRTCTGPTRRCSTSSTTCSSGPAATRSSCSR